MVKISVVIPAYNAEKYLDECLYSISMQTKKPFEVIVVNDGSTDKTRDIALFWQSKAIVRTIVNRKQNRGIGFARWIGSKTAKGEYVAFLSSDDGYHKLYIELMSKYAEALYDVNAEHCAIHCNYWRCDQNLRPQSVFIAPRGKEEDIIQWALQSNMFVNFSTVMIPAALFEKVNFRKDLRFGEDLVFLVESVEAGQSWKNYELPLVYYRIHPQSGTVTQWNIERREKMWSYLRKSLINMKVDPLDCLRAEVNSIAALRRRQRSLKSYLPASLKASVKKVLSSF